MCVYWLVASVGSFKKSPHPWLPWTFSLSPVKKKKKRWTSRKKNLLSAYLLCVYMSVKFRKETGQPQVLPPSDAARLSGARSSFSPLQVFAFHTDSPPSSSLLALNLTRFSKGRPKRKTKFPIEERKKYRRGGRFHAFAMCEWTGQHQNALLSCGCWSYLKKKKSKKRRRRRGWTATLGKSGKA